MTIEKLTESRPRHSDIAVVGMALRFPGADSPEEFWSNLANGVESITPYSEDEMLGAGVDSEFLADSNYVRAGGFPRGFKTFDPEFFGISGREAELTDPQHRLALECAWEALEHAGCDPARAPGRIGVFAGVAQGDHRDYVLNNLGKFNITERFLARFGNDHDFVSTRISYKLNLRGPSLTIQTACSTSLVATHVACRSLQSGESDVCIAGGISIDCLDLEGYFYVEGGIFSPDGHCRAFDADAQGTVFTNGAGFVVLKRVDDAIRDRDTIYAVIKGSAINNDGNGKVGYFAPSIDGQADVIASALADGGIEAGSISYVEAHGTATSLGDPVEITALTRVFRQHTTARQFCAVGSVKTNIGHLNTAAGVSGLIKTCLALHNKQIPPTLHFRRSNPHIDFLSSPFFVNSSLMEWDAERGPRRAGVTALGVGGTNAHVVLEESPGRESSRGIGSAFLVPVSAKDSEALARLRNRFARHLRENTGVALEDVAFTLQLGRSHFTHRAAYVVDAGTSQLVGMLEAERSAATGSDPATVFVLPGSGVPDASRAYELYAEVATFRDDVNQCAEIYRRVCGVDLLLSGFTGKASKAPDQEAASLELAEPLLFLLEYAFANLLLRWNVRPVAIMAYGIGEYVAAVLAGVLDLETALQLVACRARKHLTTPAGRLIEVPKGESDQFLAEGFYKCYETDRIVGIVGDRKAVDLAVDRLMRRGLPVRLVGEYSIPEPVAVGEMRSAITQLFATVQPGKPLLPVISGSSNLWWNEEDSLGAEYWSEQFARSAEIAQAMNELFRNFPSADVAQIGPSTWLDGMAVKGLSSTIWTRVDIGKVGTGGRRNAYADILQIAGRAWERGAAINWHTIAFSGTGRKVALPTYPFNRRTIWFRGEEGATTKSMADSTGRIGEPPKRPQALAAKRVEPLHSVATGKPPIARQVGRNDSSATAPLATEANGYDNATNLRSNDKAIVGDLIDSCMKILKVPTVNAAETFLECGGDSIRATQFIWSIEKKYGTRLDIDDVLEKSLLELAAQLGNKPSPSTRENGGTLPALCELCEKTLKLESVDSAQSFLDCGGDSIRATQFIWLVEKQFNKKLDIDDVLAMSMEQLAQVIEFGKPLPGATPIPQAG